MKFDFFDKPSQKLPSKKSMNLYVQAKDGNNIVIASIVGAIVFIAAVVFIKIGVIDKYTALNNLSNEVNDLQSQYDIINADLINYDETVVKYRRYTKYYQSGEESGLVSRLEILDLLDENISDLGSINNIAINGNSVSLSLQVEKLEDFAVIRKRMENLPNIKEITVNSASRNDGSVQIVAGYISFTVTREEAK